MATKARPVPTLIPQRGGDTPLPWSVTAESRNIHTVTLDGSSRVGEWMFLLTSDRHHDNPHADHELERKHLEQAVERKAGILDFGDNGCLMEGRHDPRRARRGVREEHLLAPDYLDSVIRHAADFYGPYSRNFVVIARGNHEDSVLRNCDTDYTERLCERMSMLSGHKVHPGGYGGWVRFMVQINNERYGLSLKYFHGAGGAALMSHGTLNVRRNAAVMPDADIVCTGHIHKRWILPIMRERLVADRGGARVVQDRQWHVCTGSYKDAYGDGHSGWEVMKGFPPSDSGGGIWMRLYLEKRSSEGRTRYGLVPQFIMAD